MPGGFFIVTGVRLLKVLATGEGLALVRRLRQVLSPEVKWSQCRTQVRQADPDLYEASFGSGSNKHGAIHLRCAVLWYSAWAISQSVGNSC
jgi:hypothetical protein